MRRFNVLSDELQQEEEQHRRAGYAQRSAAADEAIGGDRIGGAVWELREGERVCPYHYHHGVEEWLVVVAGTPTLRTPGGEQRLRAGDVVCFPGSPEGAHTVHGPGRVLILSDEVWPAVVVYPDSDKVGARPAARGTYDEDRLNFRRGDAVDYWDGEP
ncbi:MAG TPA: cupin domain-containing protein [Gaiellaceae bacterium]|nr:cupin domain-containing protein [Gaiellaceae bacterium]